MTRLPLTLRSLHVLPWLTASALLLMSGCVQIESGLFGCSDAVDCPDGWACTMGRCYAPEDEPGQPSTPPDDTPRCGDGVVSGAERCDDGNAEDNDGCASNCMVEAGYTCDGSPSVCNGVPCPDGTNTVSGPPWTCECQDGYQGNVEWDNEGLYWNPRCELSDCPAYATGAPNCVCPDTLEGRLQWDQAAQRWSGDCTCVGARTLCGDGDTYLCSDLNSDVNNCGACGIACAMGDVCADGLCGVSCGTGSTNCGGSCVDTNTDTMHCGGCDNLCSLPNATTECVGGACGFVECRAGYGECNSDVMDGCETDLQSDDSNCGSCGNACNAPNATSGCNTGACEFTCFMNYADCDPSSPGCETDITTDTNHCGSCGTTCPTPSNGSARCTAVGCNFECNGGYRRDGLTCVDETVATVSAGEAHACSLRGDGTIRCWGNNASGQCGSGSTSTSLTTPATVSGISNATAVVSGGFHSCALLPTGQVQCWGQNDDGQLGDGTSGVDRRTPVTVSGITNAVSISAGRYFSCALLQTGSIQCWGRNNFGQIGNGTSSTTVDVISPVTVLSITNANAIFSGRQHTCARLSADEVWCWGQNSDGQLGDGTTTNRSTPIAVAGLSNAMQLSGGADHSCALLSTGVIQCWGSNTVGQLGDGTRTSRSSPTDVIGITDAIDLDVGAFHSCAVRQNGKAYCWGSNTYGNLGDDTRTRRESPVMVSWLNHVQDISAGDTFTCAVIDYNEVRCWGYNNNGQLGDGGTTLSRTPSIVKGTEIPRFELASLSNHTCTVSPGGQVICWGDNNYGQAGNGSCGGYTRPSTVTLTDTAVSVSAGYDHTCALLISGEIACWGRNHYGQLGRPASDGCFSPELISRFDDAVAVEAGGRHTCALLSGGTVQCWGLNSSGQLGNGTLTNSSTPVDLITSGGLSLPDVSDIAAGGDHTCALTDSGQVYCWGLNGNGQVGNGTTASTVPSPLLVTFASASSSVVPVEISAGQRHTCARSNTNAVQCWGDGNSGQLGTGITSGIRRDPQTVMISASAPLTNIRLLEVGNFHNCTVSNDGELRCWGQNNFGQVGTGSSATSEVSRATLATVVSDPESIYSIAAGFGHTCISFTTGLVQCWGNNDLGELGDGTTSDRTTPITVALP